MNNHVLSYCQFLAFERGYSQHTVKNYQRDIEKFAVFCQENQCDAWQKVTPLEVSAWIASSHQRGLSGRSIARHLSAITQFFHYLRQQQIVQTNPAKDLSAPKSAKRLPGVVDVDSLNHCIDKTGDDAISSRDKAMIELFYSSGLRLNELYLLNIPDIDFDEKLVKVMGKGKKERIVPVGQSAISAITHWLTSREQWSPVDEALFISGKGTRLGRRQIQKRVELWAKQHGAGFHLHPHKLRHCFASHVLESSQNLRAIQELLGHKDISTTQVYTHLDFQYLTEIYDKAHPRAKKDD